MNVPTPQSVSLTSNWFIKPGCEEAAMAALAQLVDDVHSHEPDTLTYLVHTPFHGDKRLQSLPPVDPFSVLFFEVYRNADAFLRHVNGPVFTGFVERHGELFVAANGKPFTFVEFLAMRAGFTRTEARGAEQAMPSGGTENLHPSVMFEIIANDQPAMKSFYSKVFGWRYQIGTGGFAYVHFAAQNPPLLGGIGQANPTIPGFEPGHSFYLLVDDLEAAIRRALDAGGSRYMDPANVDGYQFAMFKDPEGNPVGLIRPFSANEPFPPTP